MERDRAKSDRLLTRLIEARSLITINNHLMMGIVCSACAKSDNWRECRSGIKKIAKNKENEEYTVLVEPRACKLNQIISLYTLNP
jgi:hypothetical protein